MPLTPKGKEILSAMEKQYGAKKGKSVFYASANAGKISGVHHSPDRYQDDGTGPEPARKEYHPGQEGLPDQSPKGSNRSPAESHNDTESPRVTTKTLQGDVPKAGKGGDKSGADHYTDDTT